MGSHTRGQIRPRRGARPGRRRPARARRRQQRHSASPPPHRYQVLGVLPRRLRATGHDAQAVVTDPTLISLPDDQVLARAAAAGRALVTANIRDLMPLDAQYRAAGQTHAGIILVSTKAFAQDRTYTSAITSALAALLDLPGQIQDGHALFLARH
jgi:hypothetical protein